MRQIRSYFINLIKDTFALSISSVCFLFSMWWKSIRCIFLTNVRNYGKMYYLNVNKLLVHKIRTRSMKLRHLSIYYEMLTNIKRGEIIAVTNAFAHVVVFFFCHCYRLILKEKKTKATWKLHISIILIKHRLSYNFD